MLTIVRLYVEALAAERSGGPHLETEPIGVTADRGDLLRPCGDTPSHQPDRHRPALGGRALSQADKRARRPQGWLAPPVRQVDACVDAGDVLRVVGCLRRAKERWATSSLTCQARHQSLSPWPLAPRLVAGAARTIFSHSDPPSYEQAAAIAAPIMIAVAFLFAGIRWLQKPSLRSNFLWSFVLTAGYLVSLPLTLTSAWG